MIFGEEFSLFPFLACIGVLFYSLWRLISWPEVERTRAVNGKQDLIRNRFTTLKVPGDVDVIVIGSGIGGMSAASILSQHGKKVLVLERHDKLGGCTHTFSWTRSNMDGSGFSTCEFDTGCHYCAVDMAYDTARSGTLMRYVTNKSMKWNDLGDPYDRLVLPFDPRVDKDCPNNDSYDFLVGADRLVDHISERINPNEPKIKDRLEKFLEFCRVAHNTVTPLFVVRIFPRFFEKMLDFMSEPFRKYGNITTKYAMDAMLSHGFSSQEVLDGKNLPKEPEAGLENTWRRVKGEAVERAPGCYISIY